MTRARSINQSTPRSNAGQVKYYAQFAEPIRLNGAMHTSVGIFDNPEDCRAFVFSLLEGITRFEVRPLLVLVEARDKGK